MCFSILSPPDGTPTTQKLEPCIPHRLLTHELKKMATSLVHRDFLGENLRELEKTIIMTLQICPDPLEIQGWQWRCSRKPSTERGTFGFHVWVPEDNFNESHETLPS